MNINDIIKQITGKVDNASNPHHADEHSLTFVTGSDEKAQTLVSKTKASVVIVDTKLAVHATTKTIIPVDNPKLIFARVATILFPRYAIRPGIDKTAIIHPQAKIGKNIFIGPYCVIGNCCIGDNVQIQSHCTIYDNVIIGNDVTILDRCTIGMEGFGYVQNEKKEHEQFPQLGSVVIEDGVHIGANTCVDRGSLTDTVIKKNVKIGNTVQIGHNVTIGENTIITAHTVIAGSMNVGKNCYIGPNTTTNGHLDIGDNIFIGTGSVVTQHIPDRQRWFGNPAKPITQFAQMEKKLQEMIKK